MSTSIQLSEATALIWQEAELLDRQDYDEWLKVWSDDGLYIIPIEKDCDDFANSLNYIYDDQSMRDMRVRRLKSSFSMSALTAASTVRTVSRFTVSNQSDNAIEVRAAQILIEHKRDNSRTVAANVDYRLVRGPNGLQIAQKVVWLANSEDSVNGIGYLL